MLAECYAHAKRTTMLLELVTSAALA